MTLSYLKLYSGLGLVLLVYFALTIFISLRTPLSAGPDEVAHFMLARFLAKEGYLPLTLEDREAAGYKSDQPPLNAALTALAFWGDLKAPPYIKMTHDLPRRHLALKVENIPNWLALNTEDPWAGEILLWRVGRFLSIVFSGATLVVIYFTVLLLFEDSPTRHLAATATVMSLAFIPTFTFISSVFSYENLLGLWLSLFLLTAVYLVKRTKPGWLYLVAGLWVGLAIVTKLSALTAPLGLVGLVAFIGWRAAWPIQKFLTRLSLSLLGLLAGAGWWFFWIELNLNRVKELGWLAGLLYPVLIADGSDETSVEVSYILTGGQVGELINLPDRIYFSEWVERLFRSFWHYYWQFPYPFFWGLIVVATLVVVGLMRVWWQKPAARLWLVLLSGYIGLFFILPLIRFFSVQITSTAQGQHILFPAAGAFAILITWGLSAWFPGRGAWPWAGGILLGLGMLVWSLGQSLQIYQPPLPVRTVPPLRPASANTHPLDFGSLALTGYELKGLKADSTCCDPTYPALGVNLYWLAQELNLENYLTEVSLVDERDQTQSIWLGQPTNGRYPTKAWDPKDAVRDEIWLPLVGLNPGKYTLKLRLLGAQGSLAIADKTSFTLTQIELPKPISMTQPSEVKQPSFQVWQQGQIVSGLPTFESRSTIQITASPAVTLSLVGPNQTTWLPDSVGGPTRVFMVDPRWLRGEYHLRVESPDQPAWESSPLLFARAEGRPTIPSPDQVPVNANFANQLLLLGYKLPQRQVMPGDRLPVTLNWQALQSMPADFIMFTRLRDEQGRIWGGYDRKPREAYSTLLWVAGEVVEDGFTLPIKLDTPPGIYYLDIGFYLPVGQAPVSLPLVQDGQMSQITSITLGPIKVGHFISAVNPNTAPPQNELNQPFGQDSQLTLLGYDLTQPALENQPPDESLNLTLYWECQAPLPLDYTFFVHIRNTAGDIVAQKDQPPLNGAYPMSLWDPGEIITDKVAVPLPAHLPPGSYQVVIGLYDLQTNQRLAVPGNPANEVKLIEVKMP